MQQSTRQRLIVLALGSAVLAGCGSRSAVGAADDAGVAAHDTLGPAPAAQDAAASPRPSSLRERTKRACVMAASCGVDAVKGRGLSANGCVDWFARRGFPVGGFRMGPNPEALERLLGCGDQPSCEAFAACYGGNWVDHGFCREGAVCKGNTLAGYEDGAASLDCGAIGGKCIDLPTGAPRACCATSSCADEGTARCNGAAGQACILGVPFAYDCAASGRVCSDAGDALCRGTGEPCDEDTPVRCDGAMASWCSGGRRARTDCSSNPFRSACVPSTELPCGPSQFECTPEDRATCDGGNVLLCIDGKREPVDCRALGFEICYPNAGTCGFLL